MRKFFSCFLLLALMSFPAQAWEETAYVADLFARAGVNGTFVVYDPVSGRFWGFNEMRAQKKFVPASTFKIANTLIGLAAGSVQSVDEVLPYHGPEQPLIAEWKRDMSLREAIKISNVPIYQELARRTGDAVMRDWLKKLAYGNQKAGKAVDRFWLDGPLKISAMEQVQFLARLARRELPAPAEAQAAVREILLIESAGDGKLFAKTGWQNAPEAGTGWWVGWVERGGRVFSFALNIDMRGPQDAPKRERLGREALKIYGLL